MYIYFLFNFIDDAFPKIRNPTQLNRTELNSVSRIHPHMDDAPIVFDKYMIFSNKKKYLNLLAAFNIKHMRPLKCALNKGRFEVVQCV